MYASIQLPWSSSPSAAELAYKTAGLVKTKGSVFLLPPSEDTLINAYNAPPRPKTLMSAGAVALCKHFERGGASAEHGRLHPYWPLPAGSNEKKSQMANETLQKMLSELAWRNMMMLHPGVAVYEIRNHLGYGMRWTLEIEQTVSVEGTNKELDSKAATGEGTSELITGGNSYELKKVAFRGFLEPIIGLDHELANAETDNT